MKRSRAIVAVVVIAIIAIGAVAARTTNAATPAVGLGTTASLSAEPLSPLVMIGLALAGIGFLLLLGRPIRHS